jgi:hypothetical protein
VLQHVSDLTFMSRVSCLVSHVPCHMSHVGNGNGELGRTCGALHYKRSGLGVLTFKDGVVYHGQVSVYVRVCACACVCVCVCVYDMECI